MKNIKQNDEITEFIGWQCTKKQKYNSGIWDIIYIALACAGIIGLNKLLPSSSDGSGYWYSYTAVTLVKVMVLAPLVHAGNVNTPIKMTKAGQLNVRLYKTVYRFTRLPLIWFESAICLNHNDKVVWDLEVSLYFMQRHW